MPKKTKKIKHVDSKKADYKQNLNYNIQKEIKPDKIEPDKIFDGFKKDMTKSKGKKNKRSNSKY